MNTISSFISGTIRPMQRQGAGLPISASTGFAGLLDSAAPALTAEGQPTTASTFAELGMFGHGRVRTETNPDIVSNGHVTASVEADVTPTPDRFTTMDNESAMAASQGPTVFATRQPPSLNSPDMPPHEDGSPRYAVQAWREPPTTVQPCLASERMGQTSAKSKQNAVQGSPPSTRPVTNAPAATGTAQPSVRATITIANGQADIIARGHAEARELAARIRTELAGYDLELASLRLNGNDQPLQSRFQVGGNNGNRQRQ